MTARIYGPFKAGSAGTVSELTGEAVGADEVTAHVFKGRLYYTVIKA